MSVSSAPNSARARSRTATRARLVHSASGLFAQRGLSRVTSHDIARTAGVAAGTFYLHFKDKESVFREIVYEAADRLHARVAEARDGAPAGPAAIRAQAEAMIGFAEENRDLVLIVFGPDSAGVGLEADVLDYLARHSAEVLEERARNGALRTDLNVAVTSQAMVGMMSRVVVWWITDPSRASRDEVIDTLAGIQLGGTVPPKV